MSVDENTLMAFVDGEMSAADAAQFEAAMARDPEIARRVAAERALRTTLNDAFAAELHEPLPEGLVRKVRQHSNTSGSSVVDLQTMRDPCVATRVAKSGPRLGSARFRPVFGAIAASLVVGLIAGYLVGRSPDSSVTQSRSGQLLAAGNLATALTDDLSADAGVNAPVRIGFSYRSKTGDICRTFKLTEGTTNSGIACRRGANWQVEMMMEDASSTPEAPFRTAGSTASPLILRMVEEQIDGDPMDRSQESAARERQWRGGSK